MTQVFKCHIVLDHIMSHKIFQSYSCKVSFDLWLSRGGGEGAKQAECTSSSSASKALQAGLCLPVKIMKRHFL